MPQEPPEPQPQQPDAPETTLWERVTAPHTDLLGTRVEQPPFIALPLFLVALAVASFVVERVSNAILRRLTARTQTQVDDVFIAGLPTVVRLILALVGLRVCIAALASRGAADHWVAAANAIGVVAVGLAIVQLLLRMVDAWAAVRVERRPIGPGVKLAVKVAAIPVLVVSALSAAGVPIAPLVTALGVGGLAVALALQDILKNIFAGIQLVIDQPIRAGDFIIMDPNVRGTVIEIGLRSTKLRTADNNIVIIPNSNLATAVVTNTELVDRAYTHALMMGVGYGSDSRRVQTVLEEEARRAISEVPGFVNEPPQVFFREFAESSLVFSVTVKIGEFSDRLRVLGELRHRLHARLGAEGIEIPFPTRTVHLRREGGEEPAQRASP